MYCPSSENKGADQLRTYREADLRLCCRLCRLLVFPCGGSYIYEYIYIVYKQFRQYNGPFLDLGTSDSKPLYILHNVMEMNLTKHEKGCALSDCFNPIADSITFGNENELNIVDWANASKQVDKMFCISKTCL